MEPDEPHRRVIEYVKQHPVFQQVLDDDLTTELRGRWSKPDHEFPEIYELIASGSDVNLEVFEKGLEVTLATRKRNKIIGELRQSGDQNVGTCLELAVLGALLLSFGGEAVTAYPHLGSGKEGDARIDLGGGTLYLEAAAWNLPKGLYDEYRKAEAARKDMPPYWADRRRRVEALIRKLEEELKQAKPNARNLLLLSRYDRGGLYPEQDIEVLTCYFKAMGWGEPAKYFGGTFLLDRFANPQWIPNENCDIESVIPSGVEAFLRKALRRMAPLSSRRGCFGPSP